MQHVQIGVVCVLMAAIFASCDMKKKDFVGHMSYEFFGENDCSTGAHEFNSKISNEDLYKKYCKTLRNNNLNNYCAETKRRYIFQYFCDYSHLNLKWPVESEEEWFIES